jgi:hypothetical protein
MGGIDLGAIAMETRIGSRALQYVWDSAAQCDDSLALKPKWIAALTGRRVTPTPFSRSALFENMRLCKPSLFCDFPIRFRISDSKFRKFSIVDAFRSGLPGCTLARVRTRRSRAPRPVFKCFGEVAAR